MCSLTFEGVVSDLVPLVEPKPGDTATISTPNRIDIPVDTASEKPKLVDASSPEELKHVDDTPTEEPKPPVDTEVVKEPEDVVTAATVDVSMKACGKLSRRRRP